jgi:hypothetical protein
MSITRGIIIGMGVMLGFGTAVMGYQLLTEPGEMGQRIVSAMLGIGVAGGIGWGLWRAWEMAR